MCVNTLVLTLFWLKHFKCIINLSTEALHYCVNHSCTGEGVYISRELYKALRNKQWVDGEGGMPKSYLLSLLVVKAYEMCRENSNPR